MKHAIPRWRIFFILFTTLVVISGTPARSLAEGGLKTIAVLPFQIHSADTLAHVRNGMQYMLHSRLSWQDKVMVISKRRVEKLLSALADQSPNNRIHEVAEKTGSDYILDGSITELAGSFSIDARIYDLSNKRYMAFFEQSKNSDEIINRIDRLAASINQKVFERSTVTWDKMEQERQAYINELKRKNPERLMRNPNWQRQAEQDPGWKIWKYLF